MVVRKRGVVFRERKFFSIFTLVFLVGVVTISFLNSVGLGVIHERAFASELISEAIFLSPGKGSGFAGGGPPLVEAPLLNYYSYHDGAIETVTCDSSDCSGQSLINSLPVGVIDEYAYFDSYFDSTNIPTYIYLDKNLDTLRLVRCHDSFCNSVNQENHVLQPGAYYLPYEINPTGFSGVLTSGNRPLVFARNSFPGAPEPKKSIVATRCGDEYCTINSGTTETDYLDIAITDSYTAGYSAAIGGDGLPVLSFVDETNANLLHCSNEDCNDAGQNIITSLVPSTINGTTDMIVGFGGNPVIVTGDRGMGVGQSSTLSLILCNSYDCSSKTVRTIDSSNDAFFPSVALGSDGNYIISYVRNVGSGYGLAAYHCSNAACSTGNSYWIDQRIGTNPLANENRWLGEGNSVFVGSSGQATITYGDPETDSLKVAYCSNAACSSATTSTLDLEAGAFSTINGLTTGNLAVSYHDTTYGDLTFASCTNDDCNGAITTRVKHISNRPFSLPFAVDKYSDDALGISYYQKDLDSNYFAKCDDASCDTIASHVEVLPEPSYSISSLTSLGMGIAGNDRPLLMFQTTDGSGNWEPAIIVCGSSGCTFGNNPSTAGDFSNGIFRRMFVIRDYFGLPFVGLYSGGSGLTTISCNNYACTSYVETTHSIPDFGSIGEKISINVGSDTNPVIVFSSAGDVGILKCNNSDCTSSQSTALTIDSVDYRPDVVVDANNRPQVSLSRNEPNCINGPYFPCCPGLFEPGETFAECCAANNLNCPASPPENGDYGVGVISCGNSACSAGNSFEWVDAMVRPNVGPHWESDTAIDLSEDGYPIVAYQNLESDEVRVATCADLSCTANPTTNMVDESHERYTFIELHEALVEGPSGTTMPTNVQASDGVYRHKIRVTWEAPTGTDPVTGYHIYRTRNSNDPGCTSGNRIVANHPGLLYDDFGLNWNKLYYYSIRAVTTTGLSDCSAIDSGYLKSFSNIGRVPKTATVTNLVASQGTYVDKIDLDWSYQGSVSPLSFNIYRGGSGMSPCDPQRLLVGNYGNGATVMFSDTDQNLVAGTDYYYYVDANLQGGGTSDCSNIALGTIGTIPPIIVSATDGLYSNHIEVTWITPPEISATDYDIYAGDVGVTCIPQRLIGNSITEFFDHTGLNPLETHYYRVRANLVGGGTSECSLVDQGSTSDGGGPIDCLQYGHTQLDSDSCIVTYDATSEAFISRNDHSWDTVHDSSNGEVLDTGGSFFVGSLFTSSTSSLKEISRPFLTFPWDMPAGVTVESAVLRVRPISTLSDNHVGTSEVYVLKGNQGTSLTTQDYNDCDSVLTSVNPADIIGQDFFSNFALNAEQEISLDYTRLLGAVIGSRVDLCMRTKEDALDDPTNVVISHQGPLMGLTDQVVELEIVYGN